MSTPDFPATEAPEPSASLVTDQGTVPLDQPVVVPSVETPDVFVPEAPEPPASDVVDVGVVPLPTGES